MQPKYIVCVKQQGIPGINPGHGRGLGVMQSLLEDVVAEGGKGRARGKFTNRAGDRVLLGGGRGGGHRS